MEHFWFARRRASLLSSFRLSDDGVEEIVWDESACGALCPKGGAKTANLTETVSRQRSSNQVVAAGFDFGAELGER